MEKTHNVTLLLREFSEGDSKALDRLIPLVQKEMVRLARNYLKRERPGHTLEATGLVNEAYLSLMGQQKAKWDSRSHFFAVAALAMRQVLVDYARKRKALKRGGSHQLQVTFNDALLWKDSQECDLLALDRALKRLEKESERQSRIVELRYFGGLTLEEISDVLGISVRTIKREWAVAKAWLYEALKG